MDEEESVIKLELLKISEVCKDGLIYHDFQISSKSPLPLKHETPAPDNLEKVVDEPLKFGVREDDDKTGVEGLTRMLNDVSRKEQLNPKMEILYADPHRVKLRVHLLQGKNYRVICRMNDDNVKNSPIHVSTKVKKKSLLMERLDAILKLHKFKSSQKPSQKDGTTSALKFLDICVLDVVLSIPNHRPEASGATSQKNPSTSEGVSLPIGICVLGDKIVVASTLEDKVKMFNKVSGKFLGEVQSTRLHNPSDMVALTRPDGGFVVRDKTGVMQFSSDGVYQRTLLKTRGCFGVAQDDEGHLLVLEETKDVTKLRVFNIEDDVSIKEDYSYDLGGIIKDRSKSKCRFLTVSKKKIYVTDLGLDLIYILEVGEGRSVVDRRVFGGHGSGSECFRDPAGVIVDQVGNMVIADSRNHRLCLYDSNTNYRGEVKVSQNTYCYN